MPTARDEIPDRLRELVECSENLRIALLEYGQATVELDALIAGGAPTIEALERVGASRLRPELTDALDQFAGARHRSRVALLFGAVEEGASMAEAGRAFSVSRQLVSRLIAEHQRDAGGAAL